MAGQDLKNIDANLIYDHLVTYEGTGPTVGDGNGDDISSGLREAIGAASLSGSSGQDFQTKDLTVNGVLKSTVGGFSDTVSKFIGSPPDDPMILLLGRTGANFEIVGQIIGMTGGTTASRDRIIINIAGSESSSGTAATQFNASVMKVNNRVQTIRFVTCDYDDGDGSDNWIGIEFSGVGASWYALNFFFRGYYVDGGGFFPEIVDRALCSSITAISLDEPSTTRYLTDLSIFQGAITVTGTVTADDYITTSRVESDRVDALAALDNISEWKKPDGSIDYKKHYAYKPRIVRDEKGEIVSEEPGLSMEMRVAMLEKMVYELKSQLDQALEARQT